MESLIKYTSSIINFNSIITKIEEKIQERLGLVEINRRDEINENIYTEPLNEVVIEYNYSLDKIEVKQ